MTSISISISIYMFIYIYIYTYYIRTILVLYLLKILISDLTRSVSWSPFAWRSGPREMPAVALLPSGCVKLDLDTDWARMGSTRNRFKSKDNTTPVVTSKQNGTHSATCCQNLTHLAFEFVKSIEFVKLCQNLCKHVTQLFGHNLAK